MTEKDNIKDLFAKGLQDHQVQVDPALWSSISSSIGASTAKAGLSILSKTLIGVAATTIVAGAVYLSTVSTNKEAPNEPSTESKELVISKEAKPNTSTPKSEQPVQAQPSSELAPAQTTDLRIDAAASSTPQAQFSQGVSVQTPNVQPKPAAPQQIIPHSIPFNIAQRAQAVQTIASAPNNASQQQAAQQPTRSALPHISLPNIFTPNNDGQNETLQIDWGTHSVQDFSIVVLDTKNNVVFKSDRPDFDWDGTDLGGEKLPRAHYIYFVSALLDGQKWQQSSSLQIQY
jgi:gliding motility-associated-like protein